MLKKFFLFCIILAALFYGAHYFIMSGSCQEFILSHEESSWAPAALYRLGNLFLILQSPSRAEEVYEQLLENFPETEYYEDTMYKLFRITADNKRKKEALEIGESFIKEFPDSDKAQIVNKQIQALKNY